MTEDDSLPQERDISIPRSGSPTGPLALPLPQPATQPSHRGKGSARRPEQARTGPRLTTTGRGPMRGLLRRGIETSWCLRLAPHTPCWRRHWPDLPHVARAGSWIWSLLPCRQFFAFVPGCLADEHGFWGIRQLGKEMCYCLGLLEVRRVVAGECPCSVARYLYSTSRVSPWTCSSQSCGCSPQDSLESLRGEISSEFRAGASEYIVASIVHDHLYLADDCRVSMR